MTNIPKLDLIRNGEPCSLAYCSLTCYPGNIYEPYHRRLVYREEGERAYTAIAFDADWQEILRREGETNIEAEMALSQALNAHFRQGRESSAETPNEPERRRTNSSATPICSI